MFTGIIESLGEIRKVIPSGSGRTFLLASTLLQELRVDQSLSHNGVCLTVEEITGDSYRVTAVQETLNKTTLGSWKHGDAINLERCMQMNGRLDGHIVQGHVDSAGECTFKEDLNGSWVYRFRFPEKFADLIIEKGSICVDGISLTAYDVSLNEFSVAIIPYTYHHTNINRLQVGGFVNLEFDVIGKYMHRHLSNKASTVSS